MRPAVASLGSFGQNILQRPGPVRVGFVRPSCARFWFALGLAEMPAGARLLGSVRSAKMLFGGARTLGFVPRCCARSGALGFLWPKAAHGAWSASRGACSSGRSCLPHAPHGHFSFKRANAHSFSQRANAHWVLPRSRLPLCSCFVLDEERQHGKTILVAPADGLLGICSRRDASSSTITLRPAHGAWMLFALFDGLLSDGAQLAIGKGRP
jgi:hypothetical protein